MSENSTTPGFHNRCYIFYWKTSKRKLQYLRNTDEFWYYRSHFITLSNKNIVLVTMIWHQKDLMRSNRFWCQNHMGKQIVGCRNKTNRQRRSSPRINKCKTLQQHLPPVNKEKQASHGIRSRQRQRSWKLGRTCVPRPWPLYNHFSINKEQASTCRMQQILSLATNKQYARVWCRSNINPVRTFTGKLVCFVYVLLGV